MRVTSATVRAVNGLSGRWAATAEGGTVLSAPGVWPLLALLADGAAGPARAELAEAVGVPADRSAAAARELIAALAGVRGLDTALALWTKRTLELREEWEAGLPACSHGVLTGDETADRQALDAWAAKRTDGLIERMPVKVRPDTEMVLASALALRTRWLRPFEETYRAPEAGPWQGRELLGLWRRSTQLDRVGVAQTPDGHVTELKVLGDTAVDVHLLLGEEGMTPGQVLGAGIGILARTYPVVPGSRLPYGEVGPGLDVVKAQSRTPEPPRLDVTTMAFGVSAGHDLLKRPDLFGLRTARDARQGHFPGISAFPLAIGSAGQSAMARFGALGFRAAAVTAVAAAPGGAPPPVRYAVTEVRSVFDRPFGFLALHRHSRLVLAAGWVTDPEPYREDEEVH
ncbi:proteinase inhibitor I4 serpin [Streptomyces sp. TRM S81-3]|uniref:Proteinase inhibitor I4 serpin n=1 Tax=Streptomyces griseicoloratus TaxID=2752516 RepID=A0A926L5F4_9ACTN|nr:serpin family protein [Streptomyces griseicoloratus]MBD0422878.1 proteinase inhibitor I4 serpin [Streptomyces griseicoloratus]